MASGHSWYFKQNHSFGSMADPGSGFIKLGLKSFIWWTYITCTSGPSQIPPLHTVAFTLVNFLNEFQLPLHFTTVHCISRFPIRSNPHLIFILLFSSFMWSNLKIYIIVFNNELGSRLYIFLIWLKCYNCTYNLCIWVLIGPSWLNPVGG